jgi:Pyruvate/2-oxoacid:ferredoxin oxidoreductase gamma subunit
VKKDVASPPAAPAFPEPVFDPESVLKVMGAEGDGVERFSPRFPAALFGTDIAVKLAGAGGDGAQTAALLLARAAINEGFDATHIPSYGPESRGGTSYADVRMAEGEVLSPACPNPHLLVAFNAPSLARFGPAVVPGGVVVYDRSVIAEAPALDPSIRLVAARCSDTAAELGKPMVKNIVALGALQAATGLFPPETFHAVLRQVLGKKAELLELNVRAFEAGRRLAGS